MAERLTMRARFDHEGTALVPAVRYGPLAVHRSVIQEGEWQRVRGRERWRLLGYRHVDRWSISHRETGMVVAECDRLWDAACLASQLALALPWRAWREMAERARRTGQYDALPSAQHLARILATSTARPEWRQRAAAIIGKERTA